MHPMVARVFALIAAGIFGFGSAANAGQALHLHFHGLDLNLPTPFGALAARDASGAPLLDPAPAVAAQPQQFSSPGLNFGAFKASIDSGWYQFDAKKLGATSVHGFVGSRSTQLLLTLPIH